MGNKIYKIKYFDGLAYCEYEVGKDNVIAVDTEGQIFMKVTTKDYESKKYVLIKSEYIELFTKSLY